MTDKCLIPELCRTLPSVPQPLPYVDTVPSWLAPLMLLFGLASLLAWFLTRYVAPYVARDEGTQTLLALLVAVGALFSGVGFLM
ncbi:MAG: hypothetical protein ABEI86_01095, partial [Halobacteriaceae archaeon]